MSSNFHSDGTLFIVSGPSGAGKTTLINAVRHQLETRLRKAIAEIDAGKEFYEYIIINDDLREATECLKAAIIAKKLQTKTALDAINTMAERFKEEHRNGRISRGRG